MSGASDELSPAGIVTDRANAVNTILVDHALRRRKQLAFDLIAHEMETNRPFQLKKRSQLFFRVHDEPLSVVAMCVHDPDFSPLASQS